MMRKANFAASVNRKTPHIDAVAWFVVLISAIITEHYLLFNCWTGFPYVRHNNMYTL